MGDLSRFAKQETDTVKAIYEWHKKTGDQEEPRRYLGASIVGHECDRFLWYSFRQCATKTFSGRTYRLFERGRREESWFVEELRAIGCEVHDVDPDTKKQISVSAIGGHFGGHLDAVALGIPEAPKTWHVCEFKTHNDKSFGVLQKVGVKEAKPMHYVQMMVYMGLTKLDRALYLAVNKDNDELYSERISFVTCEFKAIMARSERIIKATMPPDRMTARPDDYRCKMCDVHDVCWAGETALPLPSLTCRTCCHATPEMDGDGRWSCAKGGDFVPCSKHLVIPGLITFADAVDASETWVEYKNTTDGSLWRNGNGKDGTWTSDHLMILPVNEVKGMSNVPF